MIYPSNYEDKIGFAQIRNLLSENCLSNLGVVKCNAMNFSSNFSEILIMLKQTNEMLAVIKNGYELPTDNMHDVTPYLKAVKVEGSYLQPEQLYKIKTSLETLRKVHLFFLQKGDDDKYLYPALASEFESLILFPEVISNIDAILNKYGEIKDTASPALSTIRKAKLSVSASISSAMKKVIDKGMADGYLDKDTSPSMRDGRLVIPVVSMMKRKINGIIHDESATGKTVFIEPAEVVEANNRLRQLENEEKREIIKILVALTDIIRPEIDRMLESYSILGLFDFVRAKALFAEKVGGEMPILEHNSELDWFHAIHPILLLSLQAQNKKIVPLDISINAKHRILIISGPNAGGKSVCLKTVGVVQYMMQCGLLPTLHSNSHMSVFENIFIDIGDEQSLENDLSTYSSHLKNMKKFISYSNKRTLILIDEMGSGTEPLIGGALAQSILMELSKSRVMGIVTTHYQNLKTFAESNDGFINGAMLYDRQQMQPLFQLSIGTPGSSFAIEIANKIGLPKSVIDEAKNIVGSDYINMDKYLLDLARDKRYWANKRLNIKEKEQKLETLLSQYEERVESLKQQRITIIAEARREASEILSTTNAQVERTISEIKKANAEKERTKEVRKELENYKQQIKKQSQNSEDKRLPEILNYHSSKKKNKNKEVKPVDAKQKALVIGDYVRMSDGGVVGKILSIQNKKAEVAFGALRTIVELNKLSIASKPKETASTQVLTISKSTSDDIRNRQLNFKQEIDVRGMRVDEALQAITYFLDDALQFCASRVRILHGTGTGALREAIRKQLQAASAVVSFHDENVRFGGAGITIVNLE